MKHAYKAQWRRGNINLHISALSEADLGEEAGADASSLLRDSTPYRPKGSPFVLFWDIHFWGRIQRFF